MAERRRHFLIHFEVERNTSVFFFFFGLNFVYYLMQVNVMALISPQCVQQTELD